MSKKRRCWLYQADIVSYTLIDLRNSGFEVRNRAKREGRDPRSGETIQIPAQETPAFKAGKVLKDAVK